MMLLLMGLMVVLAINSLRLEGAVEGLKFYLVPDFGKLFENGFTSVLFAAMTQAFFTLSIGIGAMEIFGSYLKRIAGFWANLSMSLFWTPSLPLSPV